MSLKCYIEDTNISDYHLLFTYLDIQDYLRSLARDEKGIESIQFYMDQQHFTLRIKEGFSVLDNAEAF